MKSRYEQIAESQEPELPRATRYGLSEAEWRGMTTEQRELHYNRQKVCEHPYVYLGPDDVAIRESWSFDPYAHTAHLRPHSVEGFFAGTCECQTCVAHIGIPRDQERRVVDVDVLREKLSHPRKAAE